ncbi:hypothetical protein [Micromonospora sp. NPDC005161]
MVRMLEATADRVLSMFVPKLTAQAASTACSCWTEYCSCTSGYVRVRDCCKGCDSTGTTCGYCRTTTTRC